MFDKGSNPFASVKVIKMKVNICENCNYMWEIDKGLDCLNCKSIGKTVNLPLIEVEKRLINIEWAIIESQFKGLEKLGMI